MDALEETLNNLAINNSGYYESDSANENDAKGDPASDLKVATQTSDGKKIKVTDTSNRDSQQKILSNRTLPIITTTIDLQIDDMFVTCGGTPHALTTPMMKGVIMGTAHSSAQVIRTLGHASRTNRDGTTPQNCNLAVSPPWDNGQVFIEGNVTPQIMGHSGILE